MMPRPPADQRCSLLGGGLVRRDQCVGVAVVDLLARVADLAHARFLVNPGITQQAVAGVPASLVQL